MEYPFTLPGYENLNFSLRQGANLEIFCDGKPAKKVWGKYHVALPDGEEIVLGLKFNIDIFQPKIVFKKEVITVFPPLPKYQMVLIYFPLLLVAEGGALGGLCGGGAAYINLLIFRGQASIPAKIILTIVTTLAAIVVYMIAANFVRGTIGK